MAADRPQIKVENSFFREMLTSNIAKRTLIVRIPRQLLYEGSQIKQMPEEEVVIRGQRLRIVSKAILLGIVARLTNPSSCLS